MEYVHTIVYLVDFITVFHGLLYEGFEGFRLLSALLQTSPVSVILARRAPSIAVEHAAVAPVIARQAPSIAAEPAAVAPAAMAALLFLLRLRKLTPEKCLLEVSLRTLTKVK